MSWRKLTLTDLAGGIVQTEIDAYRRAAADDGSDPAEALLLTTAALVRIYCRSNGNVVMSPASDEIPESLVSPAIDYAVHQICKRVPRNMTEDRSRASKNALDMFVQISKRELTPESYGIPDDAGEGNVPHMSVPEHVLD